MIYGPFQDSQNTRNRVIRSVVGYIHNNRGKMSTPVTTLTL